MNSVTSYNINDVIIGLCKSSRAYYKILNTTDGVDILWLSGIYKDKVTTFYARTLFGDTIILSKDINI